MLIVSCLLYSLIEGEEIKPFDRTKTKQLPISGGEIQTKTPPFTWQSG
jgi:hypothetical protein